MMDAFLLGMTFVLLLVLTMKCGAPIRFTADQVYQVSSPYPPKACPRLAPCTCMVSCPPRP